MDYDLESFMKKAVDLASDGDSHALMGLIEDYYRKGVLTVKNMIDIVDDLPKDDLINISIMQSVPSLLKIAYERGYDTDELLQSSLISFWGVTDAYLVVATESEDDDQIEYYLYKTGRALTPPDEGDPVLRGYPRYLKAAKTKSNEQLDRVARIIIRNGVGSELLRYLLNTSDRDWSWDAAGALIRASHPSVATTFEIMLRGSDNQRTKTAYRRLMILVKMDV